MMIKKMIKGLVIANIVGFAFLMGMTANNNVNATVEGIDSSNYDSYVKPIADTYGYNKGECDRPYLDGEEYYYNEYIDHWNVDKVYDETEAESMAEEVNTESEDFEGAIACVVDGNITSIDTIDTDVYYVVTDCHTYVIVAPNKIISKTIEVL